MPIRRPTSNQSGVSRAASRDKNNSIPTAIVSALRAGSRDRKKRNTERAKASDILLEQINLNNEKLQRLVASQRRTNGLLEKLGKEIREGRGRDSRRFANIGRRIAVGIIAAAAMYGLIRAVPGAAAASIQQLQTPDLTPKERDEEETASREEARPNTSILSPDDPNYETQTRLENLESSMAERREPETRLSPEADSEIEQDGGAKTNFSSPPAQDAAPVDPKNADVVPSQEVVSRVENLENFLVDKQKVEQRTQPIGGVEAPRVIQPIARDQVPSSERRGVREERREQSPTPTPNTPIVRPPSKPASQERPREPRESNISEINTSITSEDRIIRLDELIFDAERIIFNGEIEGLEDNHDHGSQSAAPAVSRPSSTPAQAPASGSTTSTGRQESAPALTRIRTRSGRSTMVGAQYASRFQGFIDDLEATGYQIRELGGFANRANVNNPSQLSKHALGQAIDINPAQNPNRSRQTDMPPETNELAAKWGLGWGLNWRSVQDPMHFSTAPSEGGRSPQPDATPSNRTSESPAPQQPSSSSATAEQPSSPSATAQQPSSSSAALTPTIRGTTGAALISSSTDAEIAEKNVAPPSVTVQQVELEPAAGSVDGPSYNIDPQDPGPVEPADATSLYQRLYGI